MSKELLHDGEWYDRLLLGDPAATTPTSYTVVGLVDTLAQPQRLIVASVIEGEHDAADTDRGTVDGRFQRWGTVVAADDPDAAEVAAHAEFEGEVRP